MKTAFLVVAALVTVVGVLPYVLDIIKGRSKPNIVSWMTWTLLTGIATAAEIAAHEYVAAIFTASAVVETGIIVALGLKYGYVKYTYFDYVCQFGAIVGIILWQIFDSPTIGVVASVTIDLIGGLPTVRHSWQKPDEETWITYAMAGIGGIFAILALSTFNWISLPYAVYIVVINAVLSSIIIYRGKVLRT